MPVSVAAMSAAKGGTPDLAMSAAKGGTFHAAHHAIPVSVAAMSAGATRAARDRVECYINNITKFRCSIVLMF